MVLTLAAIFFKRCHRGLWT